MTERTAPSRRRFGPLTPRMLDALRLLVSAGSATVQITPVYGWGDTVANRTAWALERRGLIERIYSGGHRGEVVPTQKGCDLLAELEAEES